MNRLSTGKRATLVSALVGDPRSVARNRANVLDSVASARLPDEEVCMRARRWAAGLGVIGLLGCTNQAQLDPNKVAAATGAAAGCAAGVVAAANDQACRSIILATVATCKESAKTFEQLTR